MPFRFGGDAVHVYLTINRLSIDKAEAAMVMMKAGMFYSANGQSQADQLKAMIDSLKE